MSEKKVLTLCMVYKSSQILLGMKKRGFGEGLINGFGGKVQKGETIEKAAIRELREEAGINATAIEKCGTILFEFANDPVLLEVHVFSVSKFQGEPIETEEMKPKWYAIDNIPYEKMWADDIYWLPLLLEGKKFTAKFFFRDMSTLETHSIEIIQ